VTWSGGLGSITPSATSLGITYVPTQAELTQGFVNLSVQTNDPIGPCSSSTDQIVITLNQPASINLSANSIQTCGDSPVDLVVTLGGSSNSITWSGGVGVFSPSASSLASTYDPTVAESLTNPLVLTVTSNDPIGVCPAVSETLTIHFVLPDTLEAGANQSICESLSASLTGQYSGISTNVNWYGGSGTFGTSPTNLVNTYTPSSSEIVSGSVMLFLTNNDLNGVCPEILDSLVLTILPAPEITGSDSVSLCSGTANPYTIQISQPASIQWVANNQPTVSGESLTPHSNSVINDVLSNTTNLIQYVTYTVNLTATATGCQSINQQVIAEVIPRPIIDSLPNTFYCSGNLVNSISFGSSIPGTDFQWTNSNSFIGIPTAGSGTIASYVPINHSLFDQTGTITVTPSFEGCTGNPTAFQLTIGAIPTIQIDSVGPVCPDAPSIFLQADVPGGTWSGPGIINGETGEFDPHFATVGPNTIVYTLNTFCGGSDSVEVVISQNPIAAFATSDWNTTTLDPSFYFLNHSEFATEYAWDFGDTTFSNDESPTHTYGETIGSYYVQLIALNEAGCSDTTGHYVYINEEIIFYVPNTFSPDGDEYNNVFAPVMTDGIDPYSYQLAIYNRWGELLFESYDSTQGWDGTYGGQVCQDGTYVWVLKFKSKSTTLVKTYQGHVTLLK
jgi:gliding motility-associated-like protein